MTINLSITNDLFAEVKVSNTWYTAYVKGTDRYSALDEVRHFIDKRLYALVMQRGMGLRLRGPAQDKTAVPRPAQANRERLSGRSREF